ncbi:MAG: MBL fold metallo-hydrolase [Alphaproteobacteria bacterium]|nr:MBL fold metallo-hydrolase [Alphaproteobacteria bacterium]
MTAKITVLRTEPIATNTVIIAEAGRALIFDPSGDAAEIIKFLEREKLVPTAIYITHGHWDHTMAIKGLTERYAVDWHLHPDDEEMFAAQGAWSSSFPFPACAALPLNEGKQKIGGMDAEVFLTPGHTPGGVCIYFPKLKLLLGGDTLFADTIGRTDLYLSDNLEMIKSLEKLKARKFPDDVILIPGHGRTEKLGEVKRRNPYFR